MEKWPGAAVAIGLMALIGAIAVAALRYDSGQFDKIWGALSGLVGIITGAIASYFFSRSTINALESRVQAIQNDLEVVRRTDALSSKAASRLYYSMEPAERNKFDGDDVITEWRKAS
jgi:hypothetical protein